MAGRYAKGAKFENEVREMYEDARWVAVRSAGSHGIVDVLAVKEEVKHFVQCRTRGNITNDEREELIALAKEHDVSGSPAIPILAYKPPKKEGSIVLKELKSKTPGFKYEIQDGHFVKKTEE